MIRFFSIMLLSAAMTFTADAYDMMYYSEGKPIYYDIISFDNNEVQVVAGDEPYSGDIVLPMYAGGYTVRKVADYAFYECTELTSITFPQGLEEIGNNAFYRCIGLTSLDFPDSVHIIGIDAFRACRGLTSLNLGNGVIHIGSTAFCSCEKLEHIFIPESITHLGLGAFAWTGVKCVKLPSSITELNAFGNCENLLSIDVPDAVTTLGGLDKCYNLTSINIGKSLTTINNGSFLYTDNISKINISNLAGWCEVDFQDKPMSDDGKSSLFINGEPITDLVIPDNVKKISQNAFRGFQNVKSVSMTGSVTEIGQRAFLGMGALSTVRIGNGVTSIGREAFGWNPGLQTLVLGNSVETIGWGAFNGCTGLKVLMLPESVKTISREAFSCSSLVEIWSCSSVPPELVDQYADCHTFKDVNKSRAVLRVPDDAVEAYRNAPGWSDFANIEGFNSSSAKPVVNADVNGDGFITVADITAIVESMLQD